LCKKQARQSSVWISHLRVHPSLGMMMVALILECIKNRSIQLSLTKIIVQSIYLAVATSTLLAVKFKCAYKTVVAGTISCLDACNFSDTRVAGFGLKEIGLG
jgi:hypothetical protein